MPASARGVYAGLGHRLVDGPGQPREPRIEARLDVRCDGPPRPHGATLIDRADRDLGAADIDAQRKAAHRPAPSRPVPAAASSSQRQTASPCSHRKDAGSAGVTRRSASRASGSCLAAPETRSRMRRARRMSPRPSVSPWRTEAVVPPASDGRAIARQVSRHDRGIEALRRLVQPQMPVSPEPQDAEVDRPGRRQRRLHPPALGRRIRRIAAKADPALGRHREGATDRAAPGRRRSLRGRRRRRPPTRRAG